jgi:hypothetical protein
MMVDANRDGEMSFTVAATHDKDGTTAEKPYRFWLNNDHDTATSAHPEGEEMDSGPEDSADNAITSKRDLEDFTRLWITFKGITEMLKTGGVTLQLELGRRCWQPCDQDLQSCRSGRRQEVCPGRYLGCAAANKSLRYHLRPSRERFAARADAFASYAGQPHRIQSESIPAF